MDTKKVIQIFLSSPDDVMKERKVVLDVANEINTEYGEFKNFEIKVLHWEKDASPGISNNGVQDYIQEQIGYNYDIYLGILWRRFGSPTDQYKSGTEQEFHEAYDRFLKGGDVDIIFLFKKNMGEIDIDNIDVNQLQMVQNFKKELHEKEILTSKFSDQKELHQNLKRILTKKSLALLDASNVQVLEGEEKPQDREEFLDLGLLDYIETFQEQLELANQTMQGIAEKTEWIAGRFNYHTKKLNKFSIENQRDIQKHLPALKILTKKVAKDMDKYANDIKPASVKFEEYFGNANNALVESLNIVIADGGNRQEVTNAQMEVLKMLSSIENAIQEVQSFRGIINSFPNFYSVLNRAKLNMTNAIDDMIVVLKSAKRKAKAVLNVGND
ncbi:MAG: DUF4062 domain-containing protein [Balneolaceae bacterium]